MDSEHWISRLAAAKRYYAAQLGHIDDMPGMGMEEVEMEMEDDGDMEMEMEMALGDASWPEVACPYCYEDHDVASLCVHLEEDHPYEPHAAALLGGGRSHRSSNTATTNISSDPLLSSFGLSFPTSDAPEPSKSTPSIPDGASVRKETPAQPWESSIDSSLTSEEREQKRKQATDRATFVQGLVLSTLFGD